MSDDVVDRIHEYWRESQIELLEPRGNYLLNRAFLDGYHGAGFQRSTQSLIIDGGGESPERVEESQNLFRANIETLLGKWAEQPLVWDVPPQGTDDNVIRSSHIAERVLEFMGEQDDWEDARMRLLQATLLGGTAALVADWDPMLPALSIDPSTERPTTTGEVVLTPLAITEFCIAPGSRSFSKSPWLLRAISVPPAELKRAYGLGEEPEPDPHPVLNVGIETFNRARRTASTSTLYVLYERPGGQSKGGKVTHVAGGKVIYSEKWPFPHDELPAAVMHAGIPHDQWWAHTFITDGRLVQRQYNRQNSRLAEHYAYASAAKLMVPEGVLTDPIEEMTDAAGEIISYYGADSEKPWWMTAPDVPRGARERLEMLKDRLDDVMHVHDISRGIAPGDRNSGLALQVLSEADDTPLVVLSRSMQRCWERTAERVLRLYTHFADDERKVISRYQDVVIVVPWNGKNFEHLRSVHVAPESTRPTSRAARQQLILTLAERFPQMLEGMDPVALARALDIPSSDIMSAISPDAASARWENAQMMQGSVLIPEMFEDHAVHITGHNAFRKTVTYRLLPPKIRKIIDDHVTAHQRLVEEEVSQQKALNDIEPGLAAMPQATEPIGSFQPPLEAGAMGGILQ